MLLELSNPGSHSHVLFLHSNSELFSQADSSNFGGFYFLLLVSFYEMGSHCVVLAGLESVTTLLSLNTRIRGACPHV